MEVRMQIETTNKIIFFMIKKPKKKQTYVITDSATEYNHRNKI